MCSKMQSWASMDTREGGSEKAAGTISHEKGSFQVWVKSGWIIRCLKWGLWPAKAQFDVYLKRARDVYEKQIFAEKISYGAIRSVFIFGRSHERVGFQFGNFLFYFTNSLWKMLKICDRNFRNLFINVCIVTRRLQSCLVCVWSIKISCGIWKI